MVADYELAVAKAGPKIAVSVAAPAKTDAAPGNASGQEDVVITNGIPPLSASAGTGELVTRAGTILRGRHNSIGGLIKQLSQVSQVLQRPVVDRMGLEGDYDYDLVFQNVPAYRSSDSVGVAPDRSTAVLPANAGPPVALEISPTPSDRPSIWDAVKQQLGPQFNAVKSLPIEVVVLDRAHQPPEN